MSCGSFTNIGPGRSKNLWWEKDKTRTKYNSLPLSLEGYMGDYNYKVLIPDGTNYKPLTTHHHHHHHVVGFKQDLVNVKLKQHAKCLHHRSLSSKVTDPQALDQLLYRDHQSGQ